VVVMVVVMMAVVMVVVVVVVMTVMRKPRRDMYILISPIINIIFFSLIQLLTRPDPA
jgi:hypothetical protein